MQSLYRCSWFPGIGAKPLKWLIFYKQFQVCGRNRYLGHKQANRPTEVKSKSIQHEFGLLFWFCSPCPGIGVPGPSIGVPCLSRRSTSQYRSSAGCPRVVHGLSTTPYAFTISSSFLLKFSECFRSLPTQARERMPISRKIVSCFIWLGMCGQSTEVLTYPIASPWASIPV